MKLKNIFARRALSKGAERLALVAMGMILGIGVLHVDRFEFEWKVSVVAVLTLLFTFVISFNLQNAINSRSSDDRIEKGIIIEQARKIAARVEEIGEMCRESALGEIPDVDPRLVLGKFKTLNTELRSVEMLLQLTPMLLEAEKYENIQHACLRLKQQATGGVFPSAPLTSDEAVNVRITVSETLSAIFQLIFHVNRL